MKILDEFDSKEFHNEFGDVTFRYDDIERLIYITTEEDNVIVLTPLDAINFAKELESFALNKLTEREREKL